MADSSEHELTENGADIKLFGDTPERKATSKTAGVPNHSDGRVKSGAIGHTVEKIGGTSMSDYPAVRDNVIFAGRGPDAAFGRMFVVSAYGGVTDKLLEHKKTGEPGVFASFREGDDPETWRQALQALESDLLALNHKLFTDPQTLRRANEFLQTRLSTIGDCLANVETLCRHGHFSLDDQLLAIREMLASFGEAHSAWNTAELLKSEGVPAVLVDLSGWMSSESRPLDDSIRSQIESLELDQVVPIVTGYAHCAEGMVARFDRGYSEMTFSRLAVISGAREAIIHKEYHLSSADPKVVGEAEVVPIGRTNYDVADQLANLGMEAIHPQAARGLRESGIPLRVKNTFEPEHTGTLITPDYVSDRPCVEIVAGRRGVFALEVFDQGMVGESGAVDRVVMDTLLRHKAKVLTKDMNANAITHFLACNLKTLKRVVKDLQKALPEAQVDQQRVAIVSAIGSDMKAPGFLSAATSALAGCDIEILALHQSRRQVEMQFVVAEDDYDAAIAALHRDLVEVEDHGRAIRLAS